MRHENIIRWGFVLAGGANIGGVLLFTRGFTSSAISEAQPAVLSTFGLVAIILWGLAYLAVADARERPRWLVGVFALEKLAYVAAWFSWMRHGGWDGLRALSERDWLAAIFMGIYGINDFAFFLFFLAVWFTWKRQPDSKRP